MIDTDDFLEHFGVKGQKWGVRREERYSEVRNRPMKTITVKSKNGDDVTVTQNKEVKLASFLWSLSEKGTKHLTDFENFDISVNGKTVGQTSFVKVSKDEINLNWLGINPEHQGKGYASAVFGAAVEMGKANGVKRLTLEVPGAAPDARHIYEKQGFVVNEKVSSDGDIWGGLTSMSLEFDKVPARHDAISDEEELERAILQTWPQMEDSEVIQMSDQDTDDFLEHFGVKGMTWGTRRSTSPARVAKQATKETYSQAKSDRQQHRKLQKTTGEKGIMAKRKEAKTKIQERIKSDPEYAAAVKKLDKNEERAVKIAVGITVGAYVFALVGANVAANMPMSSVRMPKSATDKVNGWSNKTARKVWEFRDRHHNPKKSEFWNDMTVQGSAVMIGTELVKRYG